MLVMVLTMAACSSEDDIITTGEESAFDKRLNLLLFVPLLSKVSHVSSPPTLLFACH